MSTIKVIPVQEPLKDLKNNKTILTLKRKSKPKSFGGCEFVDAKFNIGDYGSREGWFSATDFPVAAMADAKNKEDPRNKYPGMRLQLQTNKSQCGDLGEFLLLLNAQYLHAVSEFEQLNKMRFEKKTVCPLLQTHFAGTNVEKANQPMEDPPIRFKIDFKPYPAKHPHAFLANLPKTQIFDFNKPIISAEGKVDYAPATIEIDGKDVPVDESNVDKFIKAGCIVKYIRFSMPNLAISQSFIALTMTANKLIIQQGAENGFDEPELESLSDAFAKKETKNEIVNEPANEVPQEVPQETKQEISQEVPQVNTANEVLLNTNDVTNILEQI